MKKKNKFKVKETTSFSGELTTLGKLTAFLLFSNGRKTRFVYPHCYRSSRQLTKRTMTALSCLVPSLKFLGTMKVIFCSDKCNCSVFTYDSLRLEVRSLVLAKLSRSQNVGTRTCLHS